jgi:hypothetical protein
LRPELTPCVAAVVAEAAVGARAAQPVAAAVQAVAPVVMAAQ